jgi:hypothetical protein
MNLVTPKAGVKSELLFNKPATDCLTPKSDLSVTKFIRRISKRLVTPKVVAKLELFNKLAFVHQMTGLQMCRTYRVG